ncbi:ATP-dependent RNA helicase DDX11 [Spatholobus suberectus]|nr:ATP-dependent RNA helicase DDX11 [Spatholobus suberectus]
MLLGSSISNTKKFLQKTLENFKSCFSAGYQKLPKTPPHNQLSYSVAAASVLDMDNNPCYKDLEKFYSDFTQQWDSEKEKGRRRSKKKGALSSPPKQKEKVHHDFSLNNASQEQKKNQVEKREECDTRKNKKGLTHQKGKQKDSSLNFIGTRENGNCMVEKKLRELEMLDMSDVDYVLDIEEVLHYYSRLTCPVYLEIVEKFFMEVYSEFFGGPVKPVITPRTRSIINSRLK